MWADEQKDSEEQEAMSGHKAIDGTLIYVTLPKCRKQGAALPFNLE